MIKTFKEFLAERFKSEHEDKVREIASKARSEFLDREHSEPDPRPAFHSTGRVARGKDRFSEYGDCHTVSCHVANELKKHYPSAKVVGGEYGKTEHYWVEIPEINHYVDPTKDQFGRHKHRLKAPRIKDRYPDNLVHVGHMDSYRPKYRKDFDD